MCKKPFFESKKRCFFRLSWKRVSYEVVYRSLYLMEVDGHTPMVFLCYLRRRYEMGGVDVFVKVVRIRVKILEK